MIRKRILSPYTVACISVWLAWILITYTERIYYDKNSDQVFFTWLLIGTLQGANGIWATLLLFGIYKRLPAKDSLFSTRVLWIIGLSYGFSLLLATINYPIYRFLFNKVPIFPTWDKYFILAFSKFFVILLLSFVYFLITYLMELKSQKEKTLAATAAAKEAQLQMLQYQLNPHFLFNALNSVRTLLYQDTRKADQMITDLSEFLRYALSNEENRSVCLKEEMDITKLYLEIQKVRFEDKLKIDFHIQDDTLKAEIPSFLLQPLVENAVKYGLKTSQPPLRLRISAKMERGALCITVENSGNLCGPKDSQCHGTGLRNVQLRLDQFFPGRNRFELRQDGEHVSARIRIDSHGF